MLSYIFLHFPKLFNFVGIYLGLILGLYLSCSVVWHVFLGPWWSEYDSPGRPAHTCVVEAWYFPSFKTAMTQNSQGTRLLHYTLAQCSTVYNGFVHCIVV